MQSALGREPDSVAADIHNLPNPDDPFSGQACVGYILFEAKPLPGPLLGVVVSLVFRSWHVKSPPVNEL